MREEEGKRGRGEECYADRGGDGALRGARLRVLHLGCPPGRGALRGARVRVLQPGAPPGRGGPVWGMCVLHLGAPAGRGQGPQGGDRDQKGPE